MRVPPAWHLFTGPLALQTAYFVRESGDMITGGSGGQINILDQGAYGDLGQAVDFLYESVWHSFSKSQKTSVRKHGKFIRPIFEAPAGVDLEISVAAPYNRESTDEVSVEATTTEAVIGSAVIGQATIGGNSVTVEKYPLRWHGEAAKFRFGGQSAQGPLTLSGYSVFFNEFGTK